MKYWVAVAVLAAAPAMAAAQDNINIAGLWSIAAEVQGIQVAETCTLVQSEDAKLTGSCETNTGKFDATGSVVGKTVIISHAGKYEGGPIGLTYTGKLGTDGAITGTLDVDPYSVTGSFTAKKGAAPATN